MTLDELIADLQARFPEEAAADELPSRSAVHRYGAKLERRLAAIRAITDQIYPAERVAMLSSPAKNVATLTRRARR